MHRCIYGSLIFKCASPPYIHHHHRTTIEDFCLFFSVCLLLLKSHDNHGKCFFLLISAAFFLPLTTIWQSWTMHMEISVENIGAHFLFLWISFFPHFSSLVWSPSRNSIFSFLFSLSYLFFSFSIFIFLFSFFYFVLIFLNFLFLFVLILYFFSFNFYNATLDLCSKYWWAFPIEKYFPCSRFLLAYFTSSSRWLFSIFLTMHLGICAENIGAHFP